MLVALDRIATDPATAASEYGALMGRCSFCDLTITDDGSIAVGYGPICAKKFGLPHTAKGTRKVASLEYITHTASGPKTDAHLLPVLEERADAVRVEQGWIDRSLLTLDRGISPEALVVADALARALPDDSVSDDEIAALTDKFEAML